MASRGVIPQISKIVDASGTPVPGAKAYFYRTGTTTPETVYTDATLGTPYSVPLVADSAGVLPAFFLSDTYDYKIDVFTSDDVQVDGYPIDPIVGIVATSRSASDITFTPTTEVSETDVQAAIAAVGVLQNITPFASRSIAAATTIPLSVSVISILTPSKDYLLYTRDASGTAFTDSEGDTWSPAGDVYPDHWAENINPGTTDMRAALEAGNAWAISEGKSLNLFSAVYGIGASGSTHGGRAYGLTLPTGTTIKGDNVKGSILRVIGGADIDMIISPPSANTTDVYLSDLTLDGNEAASTNTATDFGFNLWVFDCDDVELLNVYSLNPKSWGIRIERCTNVNLDGIECNHSAESNSDGVHFVDTSQVTVGSCRIKSLGDDGFIIEATNSSIADYNIGELIVDTNNDLALPARGFLLLGDESVASAAHIMKNIKANVVARNCDGGAVVIAGSSYENIDINLNSYNCNYDLQLQPGTATYNGFARNMNIVLNGHEAKTASISTIVTNGTITNNHLDARIYNSAVASSAATIFGSGWTGGIDVVFDGITGLSAGVNWNADDSNMYISASGAKWNLLVQGGAQNNTFQLGLLAGGTTHDLNVASGATGNAFIGGRIAGAVSLGAGDESFSNVVGATKKVKIDVDFSVNGDGSFSYTHGLVGTPKSVMITPNTRTACHITGDLSNAPDGTFVTVYGQDTSGSAYTTGVYSIYLDLSI